MPEQKNESVYDRYQRLLQHRGKENSISPESIPTLILAETIERCTNQLIVAIKMASGKP